MAETKTFWEVEPGSIEGNQFHNQILAIDKHRYVKEDEGQSYTSVIVSTVLVAGARGDYAAYEGIGDPEWVKEHGTKLTFKEAQTRFGGLDDRRYRR